MRASAWYRSSQSPPPDPSPCCVLDGAQDQLNELEHIKKKEAVLLAVMELETVMRASQM